MNVTLLIALLSLIPSIGICIFVYFRDKKEKEPLWLLGSLFAASAALTVPAWFLGNKLINYLLNLAFRGVSKTEGLGARSYSNDSLVYLQNGLSALIAIALVEELVRWLVLYFFTNKSRHFNCTFDGVVYSIMASMGSLVSVNLIKAFSDPYAGWDKFLLNLANSFPWYLLFGIVMGVFYSYWHVSKRADKRENVLIAEGKLKKDKLKYPIGKLILSIAVPIILHAVYHFAIVQPVESSIPKKGLQSSQIPNTMKIVFYVIAGVLMIVSVLLVIILSKRDTTEREEIERIIEAEHGDLPDEFYEGLEEGDEYPSDGAENEDDAEAEADADNPDGTEKEEKDDE